MTVELEARALAGDARAQVELARRLDQQGRHGEAIDWLARAGRVDDVEALTLLGLRLLTGQDAPCLPADGVRLLSSAGALGGADAAGHLAVLMGGGIYVRQNWKGALDCLQHAAEHGSASAQAQLRILAGADQGDAPSGPDAWRRLREGVDLTAWTTPAQSVTLSDDPFIKAYPSLLPPAAWDCSTTQSQAAGGSSDG